MTAENLKKNLLRCEACTQCEGSCETHVGPVVPARVISPRLRPADFGFFRYCQEAIEEDKRRGFTVLVEGQEGFSPEESHE